MSKITNDGLTRSDTGCFIEVPIWHQWASKGYCCPNLLSPSTPPPRPLLWQIDVIKYYLAAGDRRTVIWSWKVTWRSYVTWRWAYCFQHDASEKARHFHCIAVWKLVHSVTQKNTPLLIFTINSWCHFLTNSWRNILLT